MDNSDLTCDVQALSFDKNVIESYVNLIKTTSIHGETFAIYVHVLGEPLPPLSYKYSDDSTVCSSVVLKLDADNWAFVSNAKVGIRDPSVNIYCKSGVQFMYPLPDDMQQFLQHFFPSKHTINVHNPFDSTSLDKNGSVMALLNLYSSIITDRNVKFNVLSEPDMAKEVFLAMTKSVADNNLLRFTDNECYSVFLPTYEPSSGPSYSLRFLSDSEFKSFKIKRAHTSSTNRVRAKTVRLLSDDEDFEDISKFKKMRTTDCEVDNLPQFIEPTEADKIRSKDRLNSIQNLATDNERSTKPNNESIANGLSTDAADTKLDPTAVQSPDVKPTAVNYSAATEKGPNQSSSRGSVKQITKLAKRVISKTHKRETECRSPLCLGYKGRKVHYHCVTCKKYCSKEFKRVTKHMSKCSSESEFQRLVESVCSSVTVNNNVDPTTKCSTNLDHTSASSTNVEHNSTSRTTNVDSTSASSTNVEDNSTSRTTNVESTSASTTNSTSKTSNVDPNTTSSTKYDVPNDNEVFPCWDNGSQCKHVASRSRTKHFHCKYCKASHTSQKRMKKHAAKCNLLHNTLAGGNTVPKQNVAKQSVATEKETQKLLQAELICPSSGTYLVRRSTQGPAAPVHVQVNKKGWECTLSSCKDMNNFHGCSLIPSFLCDHALACVNRNLHPKPDLIDGPVDFDSFGEDDKQAMLKFCKDAKDFGAPVIKEFVPTIVNESKTTRYIYYSVFAGTGPVRYYSRLRRVLVTYDRDTKSHKCDCSARSCIHKKLAVLVSQVNPVIKKERPEHHACPEEVQRAKLLMEYILEFKKIPFNTDDYMVPQEISEFSPHETHCHRCKGIELEVLSTHKHGIVFMEEKKVPGIKVVTKYCPSCKMEYRYSEYKDGYFNFNNNSFFTISMMEQGIAAWLENTALKSFFNIIKRRYKIDYNIHLILDAVKAYMALKDLELSVNMCCIRCGRYPVHMSYDVIRSVCFDLDPSSVGDNQYSSFNEMYRDCSLHDLARCYLDRKSCHFTSNLEQFSVKLSQSLPPLICPENFGGLAPYTRKFLETDKAEEVHLPLERLEQLVHSNNSYKELKNICDKFHIETAGGKSHMLTRLLDNKGNVELHSVIRKKFTKIIGKSGGILRAFCIHGNCYGLKFLTLPESVADYTNMMTAFQVMPNFNFSDIAGLIPVHTNRHFPRLFRPFLGRVGDPEDPLSELYKDQQRVVVYDYETYPTTAIDCNKYNHYTAHPISGLFEVLSIYDEFHEFNHNEFDLHLRSLKSTNLQGMCNTSVAEQQNHVISLTKSYCNEMKVNQHIRLVTYITCAHNKQNNDAWKLKVENKKKKECEIDEVGFLVLEGVDKAAINSDKFDTQLTRSLKSPHPTGVLQDPTNDSSALNSVVYALWHSHLAEPIADSVDCVSHKLINFVSGKIPYDQESHFKIKGLIQKRLPEGSSITDPTSIVQSAFFNDLIRLGVLFTVEHATTLNIGLALSHCLNKQQSSLDYAVLYKPQNSLFFNGVKQHFDLQVHGNNVRYTLSAFVAITCTYYSCFCRYGDVVFEMQNTKISLITEKEFLEVARSATFFIFKLGTPLTTTTKDLGAKNSKTIVSGDVFDFEPLPKRMKVEKAAPSKHKIRSTHNVYEIENQWLGYSDTGRLDMYSEQYRICHSSSALYDDLIINSYARMCQKYRGSSFQFQDTCLTSRFCVRKLLSVDQKFIQIFNPYNSHWFCASNALTFIHEPHVVEMFDSLKSAGTLSSLKFLDITVSRHILQLRPQTTVVRYIACQQQNNNYDCGPLALGFLWALSMSHHPLQYEQLRAPMIREKIRQSFMQNRFIPPCTGSPKLFMKRVLKHFDLNPKTNRFVARD